jgi:hypothetical protein
VIIGLFSYQYVYMYVNTEMSWGKEAAKKLFRSLICVMFNPKLRITHYFFKTHSRTPWLASIFLGITKRFWYKTWIQNRLWVLSYSRNTPFCFQRWNFCLFLKQSLKWSTPIVIIFTHTPLILLSKLCKESTKGRGKCFGGKHDDSYNILLRLWRFENCTFLI